MVEAVDRLEAVEGQRLARLGRRVGAHQQGHAMPARGERMARRDGLHAVGALERQPDVGEIQQIHGGAQDRGGVGGVPDGVPDGVRRSAAAAGG